MTSRAAKLLLEVGVQPPQQPAPSKSKPKGADPEETKSCSSFNTDELQLLFGMHFRPEPVFVMNLFIGLWHSVKV